MEKKTTFQQYFIKLSCLFSLWKVTFKNQTNYRESFVEHKQYTFWHFRDCFWSEKIKKWKSDVENEKVSRAEPFLFKVNKIFYYLDYFLF